MAFPYLSSLEHPATSGGEGMPPVTADNTRHGGPHPDILQHRNCATDELMPLDQWRRLIAARLRPSVAPYIPLPASGWQVGDL
ncbi:hypothetical protein ACWEJ6_52640 [Nonomuraea sp. NPDC004702]